MKTSKFLTLLVVPWMALGAFTAILALKARHPRKPDSLQGRDHFVRSDEVKLLRGG